MSKFIRVEDIETSTWVYLQHLEELKIRLTWLELEIDRIILEMQNELNIDGLDDYSDNENWYSDLRE